MSSEQWVAALAAGAVAFVGGWVLPRVIAWVPEPDEPDPDKATYLELARRPRLAPVLAVTCAVAAATVGLALGADASLPAWTYLIVVGVGLSYIDWHTRLLPFRLIAPSYAVMIVLLGLATLVSGDTDSGKWALFGWLGSFVVYFILWFVYPKGLGYGDVRLSGLLGMALGWIGVSALLLGMYAGFVLGAVIGGVLAVAKVVDRLGYPFGPFMVVGAWVGAVSSPWTVAWLG